MPKASKTAELDLALAQLAGTDAAVVKRAANKLHRGARGNWTAANKEWFTRPATVSTLLSALRTATPEVTVELVGALGNLSQRYDCLDPRILDGLLALLPRANDRVRIEIAACIPQFGSEAAWLAVLEALDARPKKAARWAVGLAVGRYGQAIPAAMRARFASALLAAFLDDVKTSGKDYNVFSVLIKALRHVGSSDVVPKLEQVVDAVTSEVALEELRQTIATCAARS
jgi:hypothetical protein